MERFEKLLSYLPGGTRLKVTVIEGRKVAFSRSTVDPRIIVIAVNDRNVDYIPYTQYIMVEQVLDLVCNC